MAAWGVSDLAAALPTDDTKNNQAGATDAAAPVSQPNVAAVDDSTARAHWGVEKTPYDYETYIKGNKELHDENLANGVAEGQWSSDAARYEWSDEFGDVGPEFPELEAQLFNSDIHVKTGLDFST